MTLQEMFDKAVDHFADMDRPLCLHPQNMVGFRLCVSWSSWVTSASLGAFIDDEHYEKLPLRARVF